MAVSRYAKTKDRSAWNEVMTAQKSDIIINQVENEKQAIKVECDEMLC